MKRTQTILVLFILSVPVYAQWSETGDNHTTGKVGIGVTSPESRLHVQGSETTNRITQSGGTYTELAQRAWSGSAGILFSAYASDNYVQGGLATTGNTKYKFNASAFGSPSHGAKMIYVDHSNMGFFISPESTGANDDVVWGNPIMWMKRNGNVGIGLNNPQTRLHVSSTTSGDAVVRLEADTDNNSEGDNVRIELLQDGGQTGAYLGFNRDWGGAWQPDNVFRIGTRYSSNDYYNRLVINTQNGNVGIGLDNPTVKLHVDGKAIMEEVKVQIVNGPDYVFADDYNLRSLEETEAFIEQNKHLPEIPSAKEMEANGIELGEMNMLLLKKIEELTLYIIELNEENKSIKTRIEQLEKNE